MAGPDLTLPVARVFTPSVTYDKVLFRLRERHAQVFNREGIVLAELQPADADLVCSGVAQCGDPNITQEWRLTAGPERWLAQAVTGCNCGGSIAGAALPARLEW